MGIELGPKPFKRKTGDGITPWNDLPYDQLGSGGGVGIPETPLASNIEQDSNHRFVTDQEKEAWNRKIDGAGLTEAFENTKIHFGESFSGAGTEQNPIEVEFPSDGGEAYTPDTRAQIIQKINGAGDEKISKNSLEDGLLSPNEFVDLGGGLIGYKKEIITGGYAGTLQDLFTMISNLGTGTTPNVTPEAPIMSADDTNNTLSASHALGNSEIVVSTNGSAFNPYAGPISVGDVARAAGYWKFKVKAATGRNESSVVNSPAFTVAPVGNTTPESPTSGVVNDTDNTYGFSLTPGISLAGNYEYTLDGGTSVIGDVLSNPISVGNINKASGQVGVRVKAASGRNSSAWLFNTSAFTVASGQGYAVEKTVRVNFSSSFQGAPSETVAPFWNYLRSTSAQVAAANGVNLTLTDDNNTTTAITLKNSSPFSVTVGEILPEQTTAGDTGVFKNAIVNTAWTLNTGTNAAITLENLNPAKVYQLYFLMPAKISANTVRKVTINGASKTKTSASLLGSFGVAGNGLADGEWIVFNNVTGSSIVAAFGKESGDYTVNLAAMVIEETNVAKP